MKLGGVSLLGAVVVVAAVAAFALNVAGIAPIPVGPMGSHQPAVPDGASDTIDYAPVRVAEYLTPLVENTGPIPVTVIRVIPIGTTVPGSVEVLGSLPFNSDDPAYLGPNGMPQITLGIQPDPGPAWANPDAITGVTVDPKGTAEYQGRAFLVRVTPDPVQKTVVLRFDVEYAIGPLHFITTAWGPVGTTLVFCGRDRPVAARTGMIDCAAADG